MKAVLLRKDPQGKLGAEITEVKVPRIGPGEILVKMKACGLCGTDVEKLRGEYTAAMPVIGHEAAGIVSEVGDGVKSFRRGDRVFPHHHVPCYSCYFCTHGDETSCPDYKTSNLDPGGFSEFIRVPAWNVERGGVIALPDGLTFEEATLVEPLACCVRALDKCEVQEGETALVVGAGPVGMMHALLLQSMRAEPVVSDISESRLEFAARAKTGATVDAAKEDVPSVMREMTGGRGADLAVVASGNPQAVLQAVKSVRKGGRVCLFGIPVRNSFLEYDLSSLYNSSVSIIPSYGAVEKDTAKALERVRAMRQAFGGLITHRFPLEEFASALRTMEKGEGMKVVVTS